MDLDKVVLPRLADGKHIVTIASYTPVNNDKGGYLDVRLKLQDREVQWNVFPRQHAWFFGNLQTVFNKQTESITQRELLELATVTPFALFKSVHPDYGINWSFKDSEVVNDTNAEEVAKSDEDMPF